MVLKGFSWSMLSYISESLAISNPVKPALHQPSRSLQTGAGVFGGRTELEVNHMTRDKMASVV